MAGASQPPAALQRAAGLFSAGNLDEARDIGLELLSANPDDFYALHLLGAIAVRAGSPHEAIDYTTRALALKPGDPEVLCNRGIALRALDRIDEALTDYDNVIAARPTFAAAHGLKGVALAALNRHDEAIANFSRALALDPNYTPARFNRALSELVLGDFDAGWPDFEARWTGSDTQVARRAFGRPQWHGEDLRGKTLFVHAEQGLGDAIQFSRYVPLLTAQGASVVLEVQPALKALMSALPASVIAMGEPAPPFDAHCPIMSLPLAFGTRMGTIPAAVPYLSVPQALAATWGKWLGPRDRLRVGLAWSGSTTLKNDRNRSIPLAALAALRHPSSALVSLQKEIRDSDSEVLDGIRTFDLQDFRDTAALVSQLDIVVAVDTAVAHLAGALGKPVWILLPFSPDWRWLLGRDDSPWYPTARLYRQQRSGDWKSVVDEVAAALRHWPKS